MEATKYGVRVYQLKGRISVKQTKLVDGRYVSDGEKEVMVRADSDEEVGKAVRAALAGQLKEKGGLKDIQPQS